MNDAGPRFAYELFGHVCRFRIKKFFSAGFHYSLNRASETRLQVPLFFNEMKFLSNLRV